MYLCLGKQNKTKQNKKVGVSQRFRGREWREIYQGEVGGKIDILMEDDSKKEV